MALPRILARARNTASFVVHRNWSLVAMSRAFKGAKALEPGGPSALFERFGLIPLYPRLSALDTLDYAERTLWSTNPKAESGMPPVRRLIGEAGSLGHIPTGSYDAVLASHVLEHLADPLGAMREWRRVVRPGGHILLIVPHRDGTFDHRRPVTTLEHLRADADRKVDEDDQTHIEEILELHDLDRDPGAPDRETFEQRCRENLVTRSMHHHTFTTKTVYEACEAAGLQVMALHAELPFNIICLCRDSAERSGSSVELASVLGSSPFVSDKADVASPSAVAMPD